MVWSWTSPPPAETIEKTKEKVDKLESDVEKQLDALIQGAVKDSVNKLRGDLQALESEVRQINERFNSELQNNSHNLKSNLEQIKEKLNASVIKGSSDLNKRLETIRTQLSSSNEQLNSKLDNKSDSLEGNVGKVLSALTSIVKSKVKDLRETRRTILQNLEKELVDLQKNVKPDYSRNCTVELTEARIKPNGKTLKGKDFENKYKDQKIWTLDNFLKLINNQENTKRPIGHNGDIPTSKQLSTYLKARCFDSQGQGTIKVGKRFSFFYIPKNSNK